MEIKPWKVKRALLRIPEQPEQKEEISPPQRRVRIHSSVGDVCGSVLTVTLSDGGTVPSLRGEQSERESERGREGAEERGRRITLTQITSQPWCRKEEMSPWQRKPPASVMWNWRWCLSRRRAHTAHLHAERPVPHHVAARWVLTAIPSHGGEIWGLSQTQLWHRRLSRSQTWTHTEAQYGCCWSSQTNSHQAKKWFFSGFYSVWRFWLSFSSCAWFYPILILSMKMWQVLKL